MSRDAGGPIPWLLCVVLIFAGGTGGAEDVYGKRFDPPRLYFAHASINKSGLVSGLRGQDNFLSLYMPPVDNTTEAYSSDLFSFSLLMPAYVTLLDVTEEQLVVRPVQRDGQGYLQVTGKLDAEKVKARCYVGKWGVNRVLWYRIAPGATVPARPQPVELTLLHDGQPCFTNEARLRVYDELPPAPRVSPRNFRLWLHYGPHYRDGHWDELSDYLIRAGINTIQFTLGGPSGLDYVKAMRQRGFYTIAQRGGSYGQLYRDNMRSCLEQGPQWFAKADGGTMETYLPFADAALWDYEPSPLPDDLDDWLIAGFRQAAELPADEPLTVETIKANHLREWIEFRQTQLATCVRHWGDFCRQVKPDIETILTEGGVLAFNPPGQVDYAKYQDHVTFCDPMNFTGQAALRTVRQWMQRAPRAQFTGCQNVALSSFHNVFIAPQTIMLQTVSAALMGMHGTSIYPGPAMDAENFIALHRAMSFLGRHEALIFGGPPDPEGVLVEPIPKEEQQITLGDGRVLRQTYPDWTQDAIHRCYRGAEGEQILAALVNWNLKEPCFFKLTVSLPAGTWLLLDDESGQAFVSRDDLGLDAEAMAEGFYLQCPPGEFRGFRVVRATPAELQRAKSYEPVALADVAKAAQAYQDLAGSGVGAAARGDQRLGFDDFDADGKFEYLVQSSGQKVWVSQQGTVLRWTVGGQTVETSDLGLGRDMLWLPLGERENRAMDAVMKLDSRQVRPEGVTLVFSKDVPLVSLGGGAGIRVRKELVFSQEPGKVTVRVGVANTSVAPDATKLEFSYRAHSYLQYPASGNVLWSYDGATTRRWDQVATHYSVPNAGLTDADSRALFAQCEVANPTSLVTFGDYTPERKLLIKVTPRNPARVLQVLRWGRKEGLPGSGTLEWMYRPETLSVGQDLTYEYRVDVQTAVDGLDDGAVAPAAEPGAPEADPGLLLHLPFDGTPDAMVAKADGTATVTGTPEYEDTPNGKGIRVTDGISLSYLPEGNIDLAQGRLHIRFKPDWEGAEDKTRFLLTVRPARGFVYFGKLDDGRLLMNMFDAKDEQHYPWTLIRTVEADTWHEAVVTWDTAKGVMTLFWDGQKAAEHRGDPWQMAPLDNSLSHCRLVIPPEAHAVIDDIKIWGQPD